MNDGEIDIEKTFGGGRTINAAITNRGRITINHNNVTGNNSGLFDTTLGEVNGSGTLHIYGGETRVGAGTVFSGSGILKLAGTHNLIVESDFTQVAAATGAPLGFAGAVTIDGPGIFTNEGDLTLDGDDVVNAEWIIRGTLTVTQASGPDTYINAPFTNEGGAVLRIIARDGCSSSRLTVAHPSGFQDNAGGLIELTEQDTGCGGSSTLTVTGEPLVNDGVVSVLRGDAASVHNLSGTVQQNGGAFDIETTVRLSHSGGSFEFNRGTIGGGGTLELLGSTFVGSGTMGIILTDDGIVQSGGPGPSGTPTLNDYTPTSGGTLDIELLPSGYDSLDVPGAPTLNGTLNIHRAPCADTTFTIMTYPSYSGAFHTINEAPLGCGVVHNLSYGSNMELTFNGSGCTCPSDADGDGFSPCEGAAYNCDDSNAARFCGNPEICDGDDNDCNGLDDAGMLGVGGQEIDNNGDGFFICDGDCDDDDVFVNPGVPEDCADGVDNDCDSLVDCADPECFRRYVSAQAPGVVEDGTSWPNAYTKLQDALDQVRTARAG